VQRFILQELERHPRRTELHAIDLATKLKPEPSAATLESIRRAIRVLTRQGVLESFTRFRPGDWSIKRPGKQVLTCRLALSEEEHIAWRKEMFDRAGPAKPLEWRA
jgi:hypothetical protein